MSKVMTVQEAIESMKGKVNDKGKLVPNRFSRKNFNTLMVALVNDVDFKTKVAKVKKGELDTVEDVMVTEEFRKWCKKLIEKAGVDKSESARVLTKDFVIDDMDGLYDFFVTAIFEYLSAGNTFDFIPTKEFKGSISLKDVPEKTTVADAFSPQDRSYLGTYKTTKKNHKELSVKSGCPSFLQDRVKVDKK